MKIFKGFFFKKFLLFKKKEKKEFGRKFGFWFLIGKIGEKKGKFFYNSNYFFYEKIQRKLEIQKKKGREKIFVEFGTF